MKTIFTTTSILAALIAGSAVAQTTVITETQPVVTETQTDAETSGGGAVGGATSGAIAGGVAAGPVGAAVGAAAGAVVGDITEDAMVPATKTYVMENKTESVTIDGDVAVGTMLPETATIQSVPDTNYSYAYVQDQPVLIEPESREIVYIYK